MPVRNGRSSTLGRRDRPKTVDSPRRSRVDLRRVSPYRFRWESGLLADCKDKPWTAALRRKEKTKKTMIKTWHRKQPACVSLQRNANALRALVVRSLGCATSYVHLWWLWGSECKPLLFAPVPIWRSAVGAVVRATQSNRSRSTSNPLPSWVTFNPVPRRMSKDHEKRKKEEKKSTVQSVESRSIVFHLKTFVFLQKAQTH